MKILTVSDKVEQLIYSPAIKRLFGDVDLVLGCGDLPFYYLEYIVTMLGGPLFYVIGNHANAVRKQYAPRQEWQYPGGCENIDGRVVRYRKLLIAGLEGSMRYNQNPFFQYTEREMAWKVWRLVPSLVLNRLLHGRYLDILITHAPPFGIHDQEDRCHQGFRAFRTLMDRFRPSYLIHGHVHVYSPTEITETIYRQTKVLNTYGYRTLEIDGGHLE
ncbi:MAG: metallophosphoesterase [Anaerolineae bacterium]|nr:metallophosphoesterase [Anaerolineae bacterium]